MVIIELDDSSHDANDRKDRDAFVDRVFAAAGLPMVHVKAQRAYNMNDIAARVRAAMSAAG